MILTPLNIQIAIIKAWYSIALKSIKYYGGLAVGKNNSCLLKEARLLRKYVEILRNFKIVGSTITCSCCLEGSYTFLLNDLSEVTESQIQFNCDNTGYLYFNNVGYPFTYIYDADNKKLLIECNVDSFEFTMNLLDVTFDENCNVLNTNDLVTPNAGSPLESATIEVTGTPITVENEYGDWSGTLEVRDDAGDPSYTLTIPAGLLSDPQAIVDLWNTTYGNTGWLLYYNGTSYIMTTPLENNEFFVDYTVVFTQYEGPVNDSEATFPIFSVMGFESPPVPTNTPASAILEIPTNQFTTGNQGTVSLNIGANIFNPNLGGNIQVTDQTNGTIYFSNVSAFNTLQDFVDDFNINNTIGVIADIIFTNFVRFKTPTNTSAFNGTTLNVTYYGTGFSVTGNWQLGVNPTTGNLSISDTFTLSYFNNSYSFDSVQDFVDDFNLNNNGNIGYTAQITGTSGSNTLVKITAPSTTGWEYNTTQIDYLLFPTTSYNTTYSGGIDNTVGTFTINLLDSSLNLVQTLYQDSTPQNYTLVTEFFSRLNTSPNNMGFYYTFLGFSGNGFNSPIDSFGYYNGYHIQITYDYVSEQYEDVDITRELEDGINPTEQPYEAPVEVNGNVGTFENNNPCEPTTAEQECLTNNDVVNIIRHIDRIVK